MRVGLAVLRLPPPVFWQMTPRELAAVAGLEPDTAIVSRAQLEALMRRFPDHAPTTPARET